MKNRNKLPDIVLDDQLILPQKALHVITRGGQERAFIMTNTEREAERNRDNQYVGQHQKS